MTNRNNTEPIYIFAGGGSGGHLYPGLAVAQALTKIQTAARIIFLCTKRDIDKKILDAAIGNGNAVDTTVNDNNMATIAGKLHWQYCVQPVLPLPSRPWQIGNLREFISAWRQSVVLCNKLMQQYKPVAVLGLGGFASGPALKTAHKLHIPTAMLNPDCVPGKANKYCKKYADQIFVQWANTLSYFGYAQNRCLVTGCPVRDGFASISTQPDNDNNKSETFDSLIATTGIKLDYQRKTLLVFGGSQGGHNINTAVVKLITDIVNNPADDLLEILRDNWQIVHITGKNDRQGSARHYQRITAKSSLLIHTLDFTEHMAELLSITNLVISRAGASTLAELTATHTPAILLPYPYHRDNHQGLNAAVLVENNAAIMVKDYCNKDKTSVCLYTALKRCLSPGELNKMARAASSLAKPNAAQTVARYLVSPEKLQARSVSCSF